MRNAPLAVVVSAAIHAGVVAWAASRPGAGHAAIPAASTPVEIEVTAPLEVVLLDDRALAAASPSAPVPARVPAAIPPAVTTAPPGARRISATGRASEASQPPRESHATETGPRPPDRPPVLGMRRGELPRAVLPFGHWDDLDRPPQGTAPARDVTTGLLTSAGGGRRADGGTFEATVSRDGTVALDDRPNLRAHVAVPMPGDLGRALARWYESDKGAFGTEGDPAMATQIQLSAGATAQVPDPTSSQPRDHTTTVIIPVLAGSFDATDWMMRRHGQDPYAHKKLALLDATRDERAELGKRRNTAELARSAQLVQHSLGALWAATQDVRARKQALFALWDDCAETGDAEVVAAGAAARRMVIGFIRGHLPAGSADAFTKDEIAALARTQQSKAVFAPYE